MKIFEILTVRIRLVAGLELKQVEEAIIPLSDNFNYKIGPGTSENEPLCRILKF